MTTDDLLVDAFVAGYMAAVEETIGHTRQIISPIVWEAIVDRLQERAEKCGAARYSAGLIADFAS